MGKSQKISIWKRLGASLQQYTEAMDYGIYDIFEEQAQCLKTLERDVVILRAEVNLLREKLDHSCSL